MSEPRANGLIGCLHEMAKWANQQRCVWHLWRKLGGELARQVSKVGVGLFGAAAKAARERVRRELVALIHGVLDAGSPQEAEAALVRLKAHQLGAGLARLLEECLGAALILRKTLPDAHSYVGAGPRGISLCQRLARCVRPNSRRATVARVDPWAKVL